MSDQQTLALCIRRCMRAKDGRGRWQAKHLCIAALVRSGDEPAIALGAAEAAARVGAGIAATAATWAAA